MEHLNMTGWCISELLHYIPPHIGSSPVYGPVNYITDSPNWVSLKKTWCDKSHNRVAKGKCILYSDLLLLFHFTFTASPRDQYSIHSFITSAIFCDSAWEYCTQLHIILYKWCNCMFQHLVFILFHFKCFLFLLLVNRIKILERNPRTVEGYKNTCQ